MKVGKNAPKTDQPRMLDAAQLAAKDEAVAALIAAAPTMPQAWEALGPRTKTEAEMARDRRVQELSDALRERWLAVLRGRALVERNGVQSGYAARFAELHTQRLELRWALEAEVFPHAAENRHRIAALCDEEVSDALGGVWPGEAVQEALRAVDATVERGAAEWVREACREAVRVAVGQKYGEGEV